LFTNNNKQNHFDLTKLPELKFGHIVQQTMGQPGISPERAVIKSWNHECSVHQLCHRNHITNLKTTTQWLPNRIMKN
jgi:hypothetical protein